MGEARSVSVVETAIYKLPVVTGVIRIVGQIEMIEVLVDVFEE